MAAVKLIKFVAVAILASSSAAEPTNRTCAGQDQDEMVALQVGEQNHAGGCMCFSVCFGYNHPCHDGHCPGARHFSCSSAKKSYLASNPPGLDQEAFSRSKCVWDTYDRKCWSHTGSAETVTFELEPGDGCPAGFDMWSIFFNKMCAIKYKASMNAVCPHGWCKCRSGGCGCKARGSCSR
ncbi:unnamed protein product [Polarella glacialis]|uniref:Uncharacterized protein n=1 Tax=Polarella glacialis TaxID=89957 RepID=A0A813L808_POLGL|nr:unnamed protein product [Polarella glacialis]